MTKPSKPIFSALFKLLCIAAAVGLGLLCSAQLGPWLNQRIDPHGWLLEHEGDRVYVLSGCTYSDNAIDYLASAPAGDAVVVIPVDPTPGPERDQRCQGALKRIGEGGAPWWLWLPDSYLCERLVTEAWLWSFDTFEGKSPGLIVGGEVLEPGFSDAHIERLRQENRGG